MLQTHLLGEVVVHLRGHGDSLLICYDVVLEEAHGLRGAARVGLDGAQNAAVVLPVAGQLLEDQSLLVCLSLQGIYPQCTGEQRKNAEENSDCAHIILLISNCHVLKSAGHTLQWVQISVMCAASVSQLCLFQTSVVILTALCPHK